MPVASPAMSGPTLVGGLATFVFLTRPNRVHLRYGSRVRPDTPALLAVLTLVRLLAEQAIYMVNSFQSTGSARLILATDRKGADDFVALKLFDPPCQPKCLRPSARWNSRSRTDWDLRAEDGRP